MSKTIFYYASALAKIFLMSFGDRQYVQPESQPPNDEPLDIGIPSPCFCVVKVVGPRLELERFRKFVSGFDPTIPNFGPAPFNEFCLSSVISLDKEFTKLNSIIVMEKIRFGLWGTKGNTYGVTLKQQGSHRLRYHFASWETPPMQVFEKLVRVNKILGFEIRISNPSTGLEMVVLGKRGKIFRWVAPNKYANEKVG